MTNVFIGDAKARSSLITARSLGRRGIRVTMGAEGRLDCSQYSRHVSSRVIHPSPVTHPAKYARFMLNYLRVNPHDVFLPMIDESLDVVVDHLDDFKALCHVPLPGSPYVYQMTRDKAQTAAAAGFLNIPAPKTFTLNDLSELNGLSRNLDFPVLIKPRKSASAYGIVIIKKKEDFISAYLEVHKKYPLPIIQEYIPVGGGSYGVQLLMNQASETRAAVVTHSIRTFPVAGGSGTLKATCFYPELITLAEKLLKGIGWVGPAEVEFRVDPRDNVPKIMEVNPRFAVSINSAVAAGVDFPHLLLRMLTEGDIEPVLDYSEGVFYRRFLPVDLTHFVLNPERFRLSPSFFDFTGNHHDLLDREDPLPAAASVLYYFAKIFRRGLITSFRRGQTS
ncbi:MAG: ATP-grasp domain-containing protein [Candidatus Saganbacteria bacterium]|nr:ATP-grasp domain-containing protein [Candidatus Saganbacteria bacterium]